MAAPTSSGIELHSVPAELLHSILASRDSLRCRDLGRLACTCRLFTTARVFTAAHAHSSPPTTAHCRHVRHVMDHINAAAAAIVVHRSPAAQARLLRQHRPAGSQRQPGQICWLQALSELERLEDCMRGWTGSCVVGQDVWDHRMCAFDAWVKEAETIPTLTNLLNDVFGAREIRMHMEIMVGYTVIGSELNLKTLQDFIIELELGDYASAYAFLVKFYIAFLGRKEHTLLAPWIAKLDGYGSEVHNSTSFPNAKPHAAS